MQYSTTEIPTGLSLVNPSIFERIARAPLTEACFYIFSFLSLVIMADAFILSITLGIQDSSHLAEFADSSAYRVLVLCIYLAAFFALLRMPHAFWRLFKTAPLLIVVVGLVLLSTAWSLSPEITFRRSIAYTGTTVLAFWIALRMDKATVFNFFLITFGVLMISSLLFVMFWPSQSIHGGWLYPGAWAGVFRQKNTLGTYAVIALLLFTTMLIHDARRRILWVGMVALCFLMILKAESITAMISAIAGLSMLPLAWGLRRHNMAWLMFMLLLIFSGASLAGAWVVLNTGMLLELAGKDAMLTGRVPLWMFLWSVGSNQMFFGMGFQSFWADDSLYRSLIWQMTGWFMQSAHNGYIDIWLSLGLVGLSLLLFLLISAAIHIVRGVRQGYQAFYTFMLMLLASIVTADFAQSGLMQYNDTIWIMFMVCYVIACRDARNERGLDPTKSPLAGV